MISVDGWFPTPEPHGTCPETVSEGGFGPSPGSVGPGRPGADGVSVADQMFFDQHRRQMVGLGFRILRSVPDSEDVVQEAWLRWRGAQRAGLTNPEAFLTTVVTRLSIDRIRRISVRREAPLHDHRLPADGDPGPEQAAELSAAVGEALRLVLERLSSLERRAVLLRDVLHYPYPEIADLLGRTELAVRQLTSRGRRHLREPVSRFPVDELAHARVVSTFRVVCRGGNISALLEALDHPVAGPLSDREPPLRRRDDARLPPGVRHPGRRTQWSQG